MKAALITPWDNAWVPLLKESFEARGHSLFHLKDTREFGTMRDGKLGAEADVVLHGWASGATQPIPGAKNIMWLRRYELFDGGFKRVNWGEVDHLIVVNSWIKGVVQEAFNEADVKVPVSLIYNGTDVDRWKWRNRNPEPRIGMACHVHPKKNLPLAMQVLAHLPEEFELHIAGAIQDPCTAEYLMHLGRVMNRKVYLYGHLERAQLNEWWEQFPFCLSTSISEGNPNNVIEAMAKGIKPIVHWWPGAEDQFQEYLWAHPQEAAELILSADFNPMKYREQVTKNFGLANLTEVVRLAESIVAPECNPPHIRSDHEREHHTPT